MTSSLKISGVEEMMRQIQLQYSNEISIKRNKVKAQLVEALREATPIDTGAARASWEARENSIHTDCEYMDRLNAGSSRQAPAHFIERTILSNPDVIVRGSIIEVSK